MNSESMLFFKMIQSFLVSYLPKQKGASLHTVRAYKASINKFLDYACDELDVRLENFHFGLMTRELLEKYLEHLECDNGYSIGSRNLRLAAIKSFCKFSAQRDLTVMKCYQEISLIPMKKEADHVIEIFSEEALRAILDAPDISKKNGLRDRMFMMLLYDTAARLQEILDLHVDDVVLDDRNRPGKSYISVIGKGQKCRYIPIMPKTAEHLAQYIKSFHREEKNSYLFYVCHKGEKEQLSQDAAQKFIKKYGMTAREKCPEVPAKLYPHMFRHPYVKHKTKILWDF